MRHDFDWNFVACTHIDLASINWWLHLGFSTDRVIFDDATLIRYWGVIHRDCRWVEGFLSRLFQGPSFTRSKFLTIVNLDSVFSVSNLAGLEVHPFGERLAPGLEAHQPSRQCQLRFENRRFWLGTHSLWNGFHDWVCCNEVVQSSRAAPELFSIHCSYWHLVCGVHLHGVA